MHTTPLLPDIYPSPQHPADTTRLSDAAYDWEHAPSAAYEDHEPVDDDDGAPITSAPAAPVVTRVLGPSAAERWDDLAALQRQYIIGPGAVDTLCLALAVAYCAQQMQKEDMAVWLFFIGNPSSGKSATVRLLRDHPSAVFRDELTAKSLSTGSRDAKGNAAPSLLDALDQKCLVMADMAAFFEQHEVTVRGILGTLTQAFDGTYDKATGTVGSLSHVAHFGWLGVTTPSHHQRFEGFLRQLGPRVLAYRVPELSRDQERRVRESIRAGGRRALQTQLRQKVAAHLDGLPQAAVPSVPEEIETALCDLDEVLGRGRGLIEGESVQIEGPGRSYQQLRTLLLAIGTVRGRTEVITWDDLALIRQIVLGSMPHDRAEALEYLAEHPTDATAAALAKRLDRSPLTARRTFADLVRLQLVTKQTGGLGTADVFQADPVVGKAFRAG